LDDPPGLGVGVQGSFVRDIIQVGYGYNVMADSEPQYGCFDIGLLETLNGIGELSRGSVKNFTSKAKGSRGWRKNDAPLFPGAEPDTSRGTRRGYG
jgi:hypothetical protein